MTIGDRIKTVRGSLSRDKFALQTCISKSSLVNYETGERNPPSDYLVKILELFPEISPAWLLTGEGEMKRGASCDWWSEKIKEIRGNMTIPEFVNKLKFIDPDKWIAKIQAIEDKMMDADFGFMNVLSCQLGISVDWMFGVPGVPKMISERASGTINVELLKDIIKEAELYESINPGSLSKDKKAELTAELYAMRAVKGR